MLNANLIIALAITAGQLIKIPIGGGGATLLDITILILCLVGLWKIKLRFISPPAFISVALVFIFIALISLALTPLRLTFGQYLTSILYLTRFFSIILLSWLLLSKAFPSIRKNINETLLLSGVAIAILGLLQFIFFPDMRLLTAFGWDPHFYRTASTFLDPNFSGAFFVLTLILLFQNEKKSKKEFLYFLLVYLALLTTFSRSSYGMFLISFLTLSFFKKSIRLTFLTIVLFVIFLFSFQIYIQAVNKVTPLDRGQTASFRFSTWQQGFDLFLKNPLLGVGFNTYKFALSQYKLGDEQFLNGKGSTTNDSSLLYALSTTGILGFLTYLLFLISLIKLHLKKNLALAAAVIGLIGHSVFVNSLFYPFILIWLLLNASYFYGKTTD